MPERAIAFSAWLRRMRNALITDHGTDVPCGDCTACCTSSLFIAIRPEETRTLARIPRKLLAAAPGLPKGHVLLGHYANGHCPMLVDGACSIYALRPLTCRSYDCRIFTAAGIAPLDDRKDLITRRVRRWKFSYPTQRDRDQHAAVKAAVRFLRAHAKFYPAGVVPSISTQVAILAIKVYDVFLKGNHRPGQAGRSTPDIEVAKAIMRAKQKFEAKRDAPTGNSTRHR
jgi:uncharacterized protein